MSESRTVTIRIRLLDREFPIACPEDERDEVLEAAHFLDTRMQEARNGGLIGLDRITVMVALNLAHEYLVLRRQLARGGGDALERLRALNTRLSQRLSEIASRSESS